MLVKVSVWRRDRSVRKKTRLRKEEKREEEKRREEVKIKIWKE